MESTILYMDNSLPLTYEESILISTTAVPFDYTSRLLEGKSNGHSLGSLLIIASEKKSLKDSKKNY